MSPAGRKVKGRVALEVGRVDVAPGVDEELRRIALAFHGGDVQRRHAAPVDPVQGERVAREVRVEDVDKAVSGRDMEDRVAQHVLTEGSQGQQRQGTRGSLEEEREGT